MRRTRRVASVLTGSVISSSDVVHYPDGGKVGYWAGSDGQRGLLPRERDYWEGEAKVIASLAPGMTLARSRNDGASVVTESLGALRTIRRDERPFNARPDIRPATCVGNDRG